MSLYDNRIIANTVSHNDSVGITSLSNIGGVIRGNTADYNGLAGCFANPGNGIGVQALRLADQDTRTLVSYNETHGNAFNGIEVLSQGNRILNNDATANRFRDLTDDNADCDSNIWSGNTYTTADPACTTSGGHQVTASAAVAALAAPSAAPAPAPPMLSRKIPPRP